MRNYYRRVNKSENEGIVALEKSYEEMKAKIGVIVGNDENGEFILVPTEMIGEFVPTTISKQDLISQGFDPSELTDEQMQEIADKMGSLWVGFSDYWEEMDECAEKFGLTKSEEED